MATLTETSQWEAGIYQLEEEDLVQGGAEGIDNLQAKQLANRTQYLKVLAENLLNGKQPLDATLTAIAALAGVADRLAYFTGNDALTLTTFTAFARTLLDDADAATARTTLGAAPLASPALTGMPTAPTAAVATNTTQLATTAFVQAAVAALVNSSPAALDTLNELATALGNDANFAATMTNALAAKAPLDSPAFTGTPTATTPASADNSTKLATTAWLYAAMATVMSYFGFVISLAANGHIKFPSILGGWVVQWGTFNSGTIGVNQYVLTPVTLPIAFPNALLAGAATVNSVAMANSQVRPNGLQGINICSNNHYTTSQSISGYFLVIGY